MTLIFPVLINAFSSRKTVIALTIIILSFVPLSWNRLWVFSDQFRLWNDAALLLPDEHAPGAARIYYNRGIAGLEHNRWEDSAADLRRVISINPKIAQAHNSLGTAYTGLGNYQQAISEFDQAITLKPDYANAYYGKGIAQMHLHLNKEAAASMKKGCELKNTAACIITAFSGAWK